jgi:hypothetical protein
MPGRKPTGFALMDMAASKFVMSWQKYQQVEFWAYQHGLVFSTGDSFHW